MLTVLTGLAHFDALEVLSRWSTDMLGKQLKSLASDRKAAIIADLGLIESAFDLGEMDFGGEC